MNLYNLMSLITPTICTTLLIILILWQFVAGFILVYIMNAYDIIY